MTPPQMQETVYSGMFKNQIFRVRWLAFVRACVRAYVRMYVCLCMHGLFAFVCVRVHAWTFCVCVCMDILRLCVCVCESIGSCQGEITT